MKKILITGEDSYIGGMFTKWVAQWPEDYEVHEISVRGDEWKQADFSSFDTVFHVAGIVHTKENKDNIELFYKVNRDLVVSVAEKAINDGVTQFIFMSTMNVYGMTSGIITKDTPCIPKTAYGKSKLEAEQLLIKLKDDNFDVAIVRPPMVYGPNTVGNYVRLSNFSKKASIFPNIKNQRSMIYIQNLSEFVRLLVGNKQSGIFFPQNKQYVSTVELVKEIATLNNKKIKITKVINPFVKIFSRLSVVEKVLGNLVYDQSISQLYDLNGNEMNYEVANFVESVSESENGN